MFDAESFVVIAAGVQEIVQPWSAVCSCDCLGGALTRYVAVRLAQVVCDGAEHAAVREGRRSAVLDSCRDPAQTVTLHRRTYEVTAKMPLALAAAELRTR
jgi:hypothetical protein